MAQRLIVTRQELAYLYAATEARVKLFSEFIVPWDEHAKSRLLQTASQ